MGRTVTADSSIQAHAEAAVQARLGAEVGALVGRLAAGRELLLQAIPAPERDGEAALTVVSAGSGAKKAGGSKAAKGQGGGGGSVQVDEEWVVEHAAMVQRLLPGGLDVVGFYLVCPAAAFAGATSTLCALCAAASKELARNRDAPAPLVLHLDSVTGALALREASGAALRPCEVKVAGLADQMLTLHTRYALDLQLPVTDSRQELQAVFQAAADVAVQRLRGAAALIGGELATAECQLADLAACSGSGSGPLQVELLVQPASSLAFFAGSAGGKAGSGLQQGRGEGASLGNVALSGVLDCRACVHRREPAAAAAEALRADIKRSLQARMEALLDAAEQQQEATAADFQQQQQQQQRGGGGGGAAAGPAAPPQHPLFVAAGEAGKPLAVSLPRRAFVAAAAAGGVPYCEYLFEGESSQAMLSRLQMLLPMPGLADAAVECLETAAAAAGRAGIGARHGTGQKSGGAAAAAAQPCTVTVAASVAVAAAALAIGYLSLGSS